MVFSRPAGVGRHDLTPQNSTLLLRVKSDARLVITRKSLFLDGHYLGPKLIHIPPHITRHQSCKASSYHRIHVL